MSFADIAKFIYIYPLHLDTFLKNYKTFCGHWYGLKSCLKEPLVWNSRPPFVIKACFIAVWNSFSLSYVKMKISQLFFDE